MKIYWLNCIQVYKTGKYYNTKNVTPSYILQSCPLRSFWWEIMSWDLKETWRGWVERKKLEAICQSSGGSMSFFRWKSWKLQCSRTCIKRSVLKIPKLSSFTYSPFYIKGLWSPFTKSQQPICNIPHLYWTVTKAEVLK